MLPTFLTPAAAERPSIDDRVLAWFERVAADERLPAYAWTAAAAGLAVLAVVIGYAVITRAIGAAERGGRLPTPVGYALRKIVRWFAVALAVVALLSVFNVIESVFAAAAGVLTLVAAGFVAFWSVLSNLLCAMILLVARPFRLGDRLTFPAENLAGVVVDFNLLFTHLRTDDGRVLQVPNNLFFQKMFLQEAGERTADLSRSLEAKPPEPAPPTGP